MTGARIAKYTPHDLLKGEKVHRIVVEFCPSLEDLLTEALGGNRYNATVSSTGLTMTGGKTGRWGFTYKKKRKDDDEIIALQVALTSTQLVGLERIPPFGMGEVDPVVRNGSIFIPLVEEHKRKPARQVNRRTQKQRAGDKTTPPKAEKPATAALRQACKAKAKAEPEVVETRPLKQVFTMKNLRSLGMALNDAIADANNKGHNVCVVQSEPGAKIRISSTTDYVE